ncbi:MAG TPA: ATP-grasp domain-containing protein [bacterium]
MLQALGEMTTLTGRWLRSTGYVGAFGVDALVHEGRVYLTEVNPRFQGSSLLSSHLETALDRPDVFLAHVGAFLGVPAPDPRTLAALAREQPPAAHIVSRNLRAQPVVRRGDRQPPAGVECWLLPDPGTAVHPRALLCRTVVRDAVTEDGWRLCGDVASWVATLPEMLFEGAAPARAAEGTI